MEIDDQQTDPKKGLVLRRYANERIMIIHAGQILILEVLERVGSQYRLAFSGSQEFQIHREEVLERARTEKLRTEAV